MAWKLADGSPMEWLWIEDNMDEYEVTVAFMFRRLDLYLATEGEE